MFIAEFFVMRTKDVNLDAMLRMECKYIEVHSCSRMLCVGEYTATWMHFESAVSMESSRQQKHARNTVLVTRSFKSRSACLLRIHTQVVFKNIQWRQRAIDTNLALIPSG